MPRNENDVRSYGPGKFYTILDGYVYEMTLDGGADEEASYEEGGGWYGLVSLDKSAVARTQELAAENHDRLTAAELEQLRNNVGVILFERTDGIVESDWFSSKKKLAAAWKRVEDDVASTYEEEDEWPA